MQKPSKVNIREVARRAQVSRATVTRAFEVGSVPIKQDTKERILRIADELGYRPNQAAQRLKSGSPKAICLPLVVDEEIMKSGVGIVSFQLGDLIAGTASILAPVGYDLEPIFFPTAKDRDDKLPVFYRAGYFNGILLPHWNTASDGALKVLDRMGCRMFGLEDPRGLKNYRYVRAAVTDIGMEAAAVALLKSGRKVFFDFSNLKDINRLAAIAGVNPRDVRCINGLELMGLRDVSADVWRTVIQTTPEIDAVITPDEVHGWRIFKILASLGLRVPEDITIAGAADVRHILKPLPMQLLRYAPSAFKCRILARAAVAELAGIEEGDSLHRDVESLGIHSIFELTPDEFRQAASMELKLDRLRAEAGGKFGSDT